MAVVAAVVVALFKLGVVFGCWWLAGFERAGPAYLEYWYSMTVFRFSFPLKKRTAALNFKLTAVGVGVGFKL